VPVFASVVRVARGIAYSHRRMSLKNKTRISGLPGLLSYWI
jgi:hypothetical protein